MTVHFTATPAAPTAPLNLDQLLANQLKAASHSDNSPTASVLRVLTRALANGVTATHARRWLTKNGDPQVLPFVTDNVRFYRLVNTARDHIALHSSPEGRGRARTEVARRMVAYATTPMSAGKLSWARETNARMAIAIIGQHQIELGFEKVLVSAGFLASRLNLSVNSAQALISVLEKDLGWIARHGRRADGIRWKLTRLSGEELRERAWLHASTIDALASLTPAGDYLATLLASAAHPAWHFSQARVSASSAEMKRILGPRSWIAAVHANAGLPEDQGLGLTVRALRKASREVDAELPGALDGTIDLALGLDAKADQTGATIYRAERDAKAAESSLATKARFAEFKAQQAADLVAKRAVGKALRYAQATGGPLGPIPLGVPELQTWASSAAAHFIAGEGAKQIVPEWNGFARSYLALHIVGAGHELGRAEQVARFVFRDAA